MIYYESNHGTILYDDADLVPFTDDTYILREDARDVYSDDSIQDLEIFRLNRFSGIHR